MCDLIANRRHTRKVTTPAGIVKISKKAAAPPPVVSSLTNRIGQNATHAEIIVIVNSLFPNGVGFSIGNGDDSEAREPLCCKQNPVVRNSRALQPSNSHFLSPIPASMGVPLWNMRHNE